MKQLIEDLESLLQERRGYEPGTKRQWAGGLYQKQTDGTWKFLAKVGKSDNPSKETKKDEPKAKEPVGGSESKPDKKSSDKPEVKVRAPKPPPDLAKLKEKIGADLPNPPPFEKQVEIAKKVTEQHSASLQAKLDTLQELSPKGAKIKGRVKDLESAIGKVARKPKYGTAEKLQDATGCRVILNSIDEVVDTVNKIKDKYKIVNEDDYIRAAKDGYRSHHLIAKDENGLEFEIQVRTANQNKWAEWAHDIYKPRNEAQEKAARDNAEDIDKYKMLMSAYFYSQDNPKAPKVEPPNCPPVVKDSFGCL